MYCLKKFLADYVSHDFPRLAGWLWIPTLVPHRSHNCHQETDRCQYRKSRVIFCKFRLEVGILHFVVASRHKLLVTLRRTSTMNEILLSAITKSLEVRFVL